jgi:hypothetical protein
MREITRCLHADGSNTVEKIIPGKMMKGKKIQIFFLKKQN